MGVSGTNRFLVAHDMGLLLCGSVNVGPVQTFSFGRRAWEISLQFLCGQAVRQTKGAELCFRAAFQVSLVLPTIVIAARPQPIA